MRATGIVRRIDAFAIINPSQKALENTGVR